MYYILNIKSYLYHAKNIKIRNNHYLKQNIYYDLTSNNGEICRTRCNIPKGQTFGFTNSNYSLTEKCAGLHGGTPIVHHLFSLFPFFP